LPSLSGPAYAFGLEQRLKGRESNRHWYEVAVALAYAKVAVSSGVLLRGLETSVGAGGTAAPTTVVTTALRLVAAGELGCTGAWSPARFVGACWSAPADAPVADAAEAADVADVAW
jgi:hypothetical protein